MGGGEALVRDRRGMPKWMHALFLFPIAIELIAGALVIGMSGSPVGLINIAMIVPLVLLWLLFLYLRVTLTSDSLHIQYGLFGPKIELSQIKAVSVSKYDWKQYGGWGLRKRKDTTAYSTPGGNNDCLRIEWTDAKGESKITIVTTDKAQEFAEQIQKRIGAGASAAGSTAVGVTGVRVDTPADGTADQMVAEIDGNSGAEESKQRGA